MVWRGWREVYVLYLVVRLAGRWRRVFVRMCAVRRRTAFLLAIWLASPVWFKATSGRTTFCIAVVFSHRSDVCWYDGALVLLTLETERVLPQSRCSMLIIRCITVPPKILFINLFNIYFHLSLKFDLHRGTTKGAIQQRSSNGRKIAQLNCYRSSFVHSPRANEHSVPLSASAATLRSSLPFNVHWESDRSDESLAFIRYYYCTMKIRLHKETLMLTLFH